MLHTTVNAQTGDTITSLAGCPVLSCITNYPQIQNDPNLDLFPVKSVPIDAAKWNVTYYPTFKTVINYLTGEEYVLYFCGTPIPQNSSTITFPQRAKFISVPIQRVCVDSTVAADFLEMLGIRTSIKAMDTTYIESACLRKLTQQGLPKFASPYGNITLRQQQIATLCDVVLADGPSSDPKTIADGVSFETTYIGRAEWIKFHALFYNKEAAANDIFNGVMTRYNTLATSAQQQQTTIPRSPIVAWIIYDTYNPSLYSVEVTSLRLNAIVEAGGVPFNPTVTGYPTANQLLQALVAGNVSIVIDETYFASGANYASFLTTWNISSDANYPFLNSVYRNDRNVFGIADDWFESAYPNADAVLNDFVTFVQPTANLLLNQRIWFRNIAAGETQVTFISTCPSLTAPSLPYYATKSNQQYNCPGNLLQPYNLPSTSSAPTSNSPSTASSSGTTIHPTTHGANSAMAMVSSVFIALFALFACFVMIGYIN